MDADRNVQEQVTTEFDKKRKEAEDAAEAKTAKNRAKRQKKKAKAKGGASNSKSESNDPSNPNASESSAPLKKRRLVNGQELLFKRPGEESDDEEDVGPQMPTSEQKGDEEPQAIPAAPAVENKITIIEDD